MASLADVDESSREVLLRKIQRSSEDIAGRCREAMEQTKENMTTSLFDHEERERVVEAYAQKLRTSRDEMIAKIEQQQAAERATLIGELKRDVGGILEGVLDTLKEELERDEREAAEDSDRRRAEHVRSVLKEHVDASRRFTEDQLQALREAMAAQRDDALREYHDEMARFREEQLAELSKLNFDDLAHDALSTAASEDLFHDDTSLVAGDTAPPSVYGGITERRRTTAR